MVLSHPLTLRSKLKMQVGTSKPFGGGWLIFKISQASDYLRTPFSTHRQAVSSNNKQWAFVSNFSDFLNKYFNYQLKFKAYFGLKISLYYFFFQAQHGPEKRSILMSFFLQTPAPLSLILNKAPRIPDSKGFLREFCVFALTLFLPLPLKFGCC